MIALLVSIKTRLEALAATLGQMSEVTAVSHGYCVATYEMQKDESRFESYVEITLVDKDELYWTLDIIESKAGWRVERSIDRRSFQVKYDYGAIGLVDFDDWSGATEADLATALPKLLDEFCANLPEVLRASTEARGKEAKTHELRKL